ncbi:hypothetical protein IV102_09300 [bacterium]|nr:hypothetical protein [bacterium]
MVELDPYFDCDGHLLLDALALSAAFGTPFELREIRAFEEKHKGLRPHQLAAIQLTGMLCGAEVRLSDTEVNFSPGPLRAGDFAVSIKTAGPISSVLQAALLPALLAPGPVTLTILGGTDVLYRPNLAYVENVLLPYYRMFADISLKVIHRGIFPRGEGKVVVRIEDQRPAPAPDFAESPGFESFHLQVVGDASNGDEILEKLQDRLGKPLLVERLSPDLNVMSLCLWAQARSGNWPCVVGSWRVGDSGMTPKFGIKLVNELLERLTPPLYDPRVELLAWLAGGPLAETATQESKELAATKYLIGTMGKVS